MPENELQENKYRPIFPNMMADLKSFLSSKAKDIKFGTSNSVTEIPYLLIDSFNASMKQDGSSFSPKQMALYDGGLSVNLYVQLNKVASYYDMIVNLLYAWSAERRFIDFKIVEKTMYNIREEVDCYTIQLVVRFTFLDYMVDSTFPIISEEACDPVVDTMGPHLMRVDNVEVISETHV